MSSSYEKYKRQRAAKSNSGEYTTKKNTKKGNKFFYNLKMFTIYLNG